MEVEILPEPSAAERAAIVLALEVELEQRGRAEPPLLDDGEIEEGFYSLHEVPPPLGALRRQVG